MPSPVSSLSLLLTESACLRSSDVNKQEPLLFPILIYDTNPLCLSAGEGNRLPYKWVIVPHVDSPFPSVERVSPQQIHHDQAHWLPQRQVLAILDVDANNHSLTLALPPESYLRKRERESRGDLPQDLSQENQIRAQCIWKPKLESFPNKKTIVHLLVVSVFVSAFVCSCISVSNHHPDLQTWVLNWNLFSLILQWFVAASI